MSLFSKKKNDDDVTNDMKDVFEGNADLSLEEGKSDEAKTEVNEKSLELTSLDLNKEDLELEVTKEDVEGLDDFSERPMPIKSRIGFYEAGIAKKEVIQAIRNIAINDFGTKKGVYYNIVKYNGGFLYEVHHGCEFGVIKEIIKKVSTQDLVLETNDATFKIYVKSNGHVSMLKLRSADSNVDNFEKLTPKDKLSTLESSGYGMYVFGICVASLGVLALSVSSLVKHVFIDQEQSIMYEQQNKILASDYLNSINSTAGTLKKDTQYILYVEYSEAKGWDMKVGSVQDPASDTITDEPVYFVDGKAVPIEQDSGNVEGEENEDIK